MAGPKSSSVNIRSAESAIISSIPAKGLPTARNCSVKLETIPSIVSNILGTS